MPRPHGWQCWICYLLVYGDLAPKLIRRAKHYRTVTLTLKQGLQDARGNADDDDDNGNEDDAGAGAILEVVVERMDTEND